MRLVTLLVFTSILVCAQSRKPASPNERQRDAKLRKELTSAYRTWMNAEVGYIITDEERQAFNRLGTDDERQQFVEQFWIRRDPTPDTEENEYKEEHYRRIAHANERFSSGVPGWKTDRGRIYITFGPPDETETHASGGSYLRPIEEGGGTTATFPFEIWRYRHLENIGSDIQIEFVDPTMTGEYRMTIDPSEKDALLRVSGAGLTMIEQLGFADKRERFSRTDGTRLGTGSTPLPARMSQFDRMSQMAMLNRAPALPKDKALQELVKSQIRYNTMPMGVQVHYVPTGASSILTAITIQFDRRDLQFVETDGVARATVNLFARVHSITRRPVNSFEQAISVEVPATGNSGTRSGISLFQKVLPLATGKYRLSIVARDVVSGSMNTYEQGLDVPGFADDRLQASSLILADLIEKVPTSSVGAGQFVIGSNKVRPRLNARFSRHEDLGLFWNLYNFQPDEKTQKPAGMIRISITRAGSTVPVAEFAEPVTRAAQFALARRIPLTAFEPGDYTVNLEAVDANRRNSNLSNAEGIVKVSGIFHVE